MFRLNYCAVESRREMNYVQVGLLCQTVYVPLISFTLGQLIFRHDVECNMIVDLTRIGLFLLGISPGILLYIIIFLILI